MIPNCVIRLLRNTALAILAQAACAVNFSEVHHDKSANELVITMTYRGTNPNHGYTLKWGECRDDQSGKLPGVTVEVLDDQWKDRAERDYVKATRFGLAGLPSTRPARVTLRTAHRFIYTLTIPR